MSTFIFLYFILVFFLFFTGIFTYRKYKKYSGLFFLLSCIFLGLWFLLYILIFGYITDGDILLFVFRIMYCLSFLGLISMLIFIYYFNTIIKKLYKNLFILLFFLISIVFTFTPFVVTNLKYIEEKKYFFENYGILYNVVILLYFLYIPLFLILSYYKIKRLNYINKMRLKIICFGFGIFSISSLLFCIFLPFFGIYLFADGVVLFSLPFIISVLYTTNLYNFSDFKIKFGKILIFLFSIFYSIFFVNVLKNYYSTLSNNFLDFWGLSPIFGITDLVLGIIIFVVSNNFLNKVFLGNTKKDKIRLKLLEIKSNIPYISSLEKLNNYLKNQFKIIFKINYINVLLFEKNCHKLELYNFFQKDISREFFINDKVFIEENKYKFNLKKISDQIDKNIYIIFPLRNNKRKLIGILELGSKPFKDQYNIEEIKIIKIFSEFIVGHLKYLDIYSDIYDLNINLDKKVDEKTIEYNTLLSKQREFIGMSSHEIKTPVASAVFQIDCLIDDFNEGKQNNSYYKEQLSILNEQLLKLGSLVNKIFTVEEYDIKEIKLFIEKINLNVLLLTEIERFKKVNNKTKVNLKIEDNIGYIDIDKVQFTQVIDNLLNNAIKFSQKNNSVINIIAYKKMGNLIVKIEDNGKGFSDINMEDIFGKYFTGGLSSVGIGLGLYLCKKIISMHNGTIKAKNSIELGGASFEIQIPIKQYLKK